MKTRIGMGWGQGGVEVGPKGSSRPAHVVLDEEQRPRPPPRDLDEARDRAAHADSHLGVEIGRGLVEEVEVCGDAEAERDGDALRLVRVRVRVWG